MFAKKEGVIIAVLMVVSFLFAGQVFATVDDLAKQANKLVRDAERKMHSGKNTDADLLLQKAVALIEQGKAQDPNNNKILQIEKKYTRIKKNVDKKLRENQPTESASTAPAITTSSDDNKLPSGVTKRLRDIKRHLDRAERYIEKYAEQIQYLLGQANSLFEEIEKNYGGQFDPNHTDFATMMTRYNDLTQKNAGQFEAEKKVKADAEGTKAAMEKQSAEWVAQFNEYLSYPGQEEHNPDKLVFVPGTSEPEKFNKAQKNFDAFVAFYETYKQTEFTHGKTWKLAGTNS